MLEELKNIKKENLYLIFALGAGLVMAIFNPSFAGVPDEHAHYWKAWSVAEGYWMCTGQDAIPIGAYNLPESIQPQKIKGLEDKKIIVANLKKELFNNRSDESKIIGGSVCAASPVGYFPQTVGLKAGSLLGLSELASFYLARIFNLVVGIFIMYWAIRIMPFGKIFFVIIGLLPMTLQQFSSLGYDAMVISLALLFIAYVCKLSFGQQSELSPKDIIKLFALSIFGLSVKPGYFLIAALVFLIPREKFKNKAQYLLVCAGIVLANLAVFFIIQSIFRDTGDIFKDGVNPDFQMLYVLSHPMQFINSVLETFYLKIIFFTETFLYKPGWLNNSLPPIFYIFTILGLILIARNTEEEVKMEKWQRGVLFLIFLTNFFLIFASLYAVWTKVGAQTITGVQGRYFLAIAPLLCLALYKSKFNFKFDFVKNHHSFFTILFFAILFLSSFWFIFKIYYDKSGAGKEGTYVYVRQASTEEVRKITPVKLDGPLAQKFVSQSDYFTGIKIYVGEGLIANDIVFELRDENCQEILDKKSIKKDAGEITSIEIKFTTRVGTENKRLCLYSENFYQSTLLPRIADGLYDNGELMIMGEKNSGNLVFDLIYKNVN